jgi:hypothetical protein
VTLSLAKWFVQKKLRGIVRFIHIGQMQLVGRAVLCAPIFVDTTTAGRGLPALPFTAFVFFARHDFNKFFRVFRLFRG